jgi:hypothetical protein
MTGCKDVNNHYRFLVMDDGLGFGLISKIWRSLELHVCDQCVCVQNGGG